MPTTFRRVAAAVKASTRRVCDLLGGACDVLDDLAIDTLLVVAVVVERTAARARARRRGRELCSPGCLTLDDDDAFDDDVAAFADAVAHARELGRRRNLGVAVESLPGGPS